MSPTATRTLSTAEERREAVLEAGMTVFAERGYFGTPTLDVARAAGISQAYLFRLFPTKEELFAAVLMRSCARIYDVFAGAAVRARAAGEPPLPVLGQAYVELLQDRTVLLVFLHGEAAASVPQVRDAARAGWRRLVELVKHESGAPDEDVRRFFATGMLLNAVAAVEANTLDEDWARTLSPH